MKKALVIIDMQIMPFIWKDYGGKPVYQEDQIVENIKKLIKKAKDADVPVYYVMYTESEGSPRAKNQPLWQIHPEISPAAQDKVIIKYHADSFYKSVLSTDDTSDAVQNPIDATQEPDMERTYFTVDFFGEAAGNPMFISLNLPMGWTSDPSGILDAQGDWIASIEVHKIATDRPFADIDEQYKDVVATKEMTVSGYPAKLYVLELELDGSEGRTRTQYLYYIMVDDSYVLVFFSPEETNGMDEDEFDKIVYSFGVAAG